MPSDVKAMTAAIANLHEWLEVSKQWGNRALPIIVCYWYHCLVCLLWAQENAFHLLSGHTMLLILWFIYFFVAGKLKWWDVPMCHCMFFHQVFICSWQMTTQTSIATEIALWAPQFLSLHIRQTHAGATKNDNAFCLGAVRSAVSQCISNTVQQRQLGEQRGHSQRKESPTALHNLSW